jgi:hypothetical protein
MADRKGHGDHREPECQRNAEQTDADVRKGCGKYGAAAAAEDQPKCTDEFGRKFPCKWQVRLLKVALKWLGGAFSHIDT